MTQRIAAFFLRGEQIGTATVTSSINRQGRIFPYSTVFVCPKCGDAWGKVVIPFQSFICRLRSCDQHGAGILWPSDPYEQFSNYSEGLLKHTLLHITRLPNPGTLPEYALVGDNP